jgi:hypothetical protein
MKLTGEEWHAYPMGSGYQLIKLIRVGDGACWVEENGNRRREREWGRRKKEEMRKKGVDGLCITQGCQPRWRPWCTTGRQGGWRPSWWDLGPSRRASNLMPPCSCTRTPTPLGAGGFGRRVPRRTSLGLVLYRPTRPLSMVPYSFLRASGLMATL